MRASVGTLSSGSGGAPGPSVGKSSSLGGGTTAATFLRDPDPRLTQPLCGR